MKRLPLYGHTAVTWFGSTTLAYLNGLKSSLMWIGGLFLGTFVPKKGFGGPCGVGLDVCRSRGGGRGEGGGAAAAPRLPPPVLRELEHARRHARGDRARALPRSTVRVALALACALGGPDATRPLANLANRRAVFAAAEPKHEYEPRGHIRGRAFVAAAGPGSRRRGGRQSSRRPASATRRRSRNLRPSTSASRRWQRYPWCP